MRAVCMLCPLSWQLSSSSLVIEMFGGWEHISQLVLLPLGMGVQRYHSQCVTNTRHDNIGGLKCVCFFFAVLQLENSTNIVQEYSIPESRNNGVRLHSLYTVVPNPSGRLQV